MFKDFYSKDYFKALGIDLRPYINRSKYNIQRNNKVKPYEVSIEINIMV